MTCRFSSFSQTVLSFHELLLYCICLLAVSSSFDTLNDEKLATGGLKQKLWIVAVLSDSVKQIKDFHRTIIVSFTY